MTKRCIKSLTLPDLEAAMAELGEKPFRARQIFPWLFRRDAATFAEMTNLGKELQQKLEERYFILRLPVEQLLESEDGTQKIGLRTQDGHLIESVLIPEERRLTVCISSQIGCRYGCKFCRTGTMGFIRNLTPGEIVEQYMAAQRIAGERRISNMVLMGMGEPLDNFENVVAAIHIFRADHGLNLSPRKVTLSTVGLPDKMDELGKLVDISLAISLHAADDATRDKIVPVNKKHPLEELLAACRRFPLSPRRRLTFEYALVKGVNDSLEHAQDLVKLARPLRAKINLIPCNPFDGSGLEPPEEKTVHDFEQYLLDSNMTAIVRKPRGRDILAACGQLATADRKKSKS